MYAVKPGFDMVKYWIVDKPHGWKQSRQPSVVANELIRRSDSYLVNNGFLYIDGGLRYDVDDLESLVA